MSDTNAEILAGTSGNLDDVQVQSPLKKLFEQMEKVLQGTATSDEKESARKSLGAVFGEPAAVDRAVADGKTAD
jgi:hypothetical protein